MHQMVIENAQQQGAGAQIPVPDPPSYVRCIAAADAVQARSKHGTKLSRQELRRRCAQVYAQLRDAALAFLITADWLQGEAATQGVAVSSSEVDASYRQLLDGPAGPGLARRLRLSGMTSADELLQLRIDKLAEKLRTKIGAGDTGVSTAQIGAYYHSHASQFQVPRHARQTLAAVTPTIRQKLAQAVQERRVSTFIAEYRQRWKQRTTCAPGYVIPECRNSSRVLASPTN
jgi:hypothetical protein